MSEIDNADPTLDPIAGKADFDEAQPIAYGETASGSVDGHAFSLFRLAVDENDELALTVRRTTGEFEPRSVGYDTNLTRLDHVRGSFESVADGNRKAFLMGRYASSIYVVVRADGYEGAGDFDLTVECTGGPCAGEHPLDGFEAVETARCLGRARECAFGRLATESVGDFAEAEALFDVCLSEQEGCSALACDAPSLGDERTPREHCDSVAEALVFYAGRSTECTQALLGCMDTCGEYEENSPYIEYDAHEFEFWMTGEAMCWFNPYGGSCDSFARGHEVCDGPEYREVGGTQTAGTCFADWRATEGAWLEFEDDNLDCSHVCEAVETECTAECETDDADVWADCFQDCSADHALLADDDYYICDF